MPHFLPAHPKNHLSSTSTPSVYRSNGNGISTWTADEFDFWGGDQRSSNVSDRYDDFSGQRHPDDEDYGAYSPRFWSSSPLVPRDHHYSYPSPQSRPQAIVDGRRDIMEMIQDMPESSESYELSFKDIVDEQQVQHKDIVIDELSLNFNFKPGVDRKQLEEEKKKKKKRTCKRDKMTRSPSVGSEAFLIKMFFPSFLSMRGKSTVGNLCPKVSPKQSLDGSEKMGDKEPWKMRFLDLVEGKKSRKSSIRGSTSSRGSSNSSRRQDDSNFTLSCWSFV